MIELLPAIDLRQGGVVRLLRGEDDSRTEYPTPPEKALFEFARAGVRWVHIVDLDGAFGEAPQRPLLESLARTNFGEVTAPSLQVGGGFSDRSGVDWALAAGCERVVVGSMMVRDPEGFRDLVLAHPKRIVAALDVRAGQLAVSGWTETAETPLDEFAAGLSGLPLAAVLVTDVSRDGTLEGPNVDLVAHLARLAGAPGIVSGGVGSVADLERIAVRARTGELDHIFGVIVGRALWDGRMTLEEALVALAGGRCETASEILR